MYAADEHDESTERNPIKPDESARMDAFQKMYVCHISLVSNTLFEMHCEALQLNYKPIGGTDA